MRESLKMLGKILNGMIVRDNEKVIDCWRKNGARLLYLKGKGERRDYLRFGSKMNRSSEQ